LDVSDQAGDASSAFIRAQVLRTPVPQRTQGPCRRNPWDKAAETRQKLVDRLTEAERRHDFYQGLYRQYATDLVRLAAHVRQIVATKPLRDALSAHHPDALKLFKAIMEQSGDSAVG
jgi:ParB family transcriptional regulator, chromosome partitioning protein